MPDPTDPVRYRGCLPPHPVLQGCLIIGGMALLAAVLFPLFARGRRDEPQNPCLSNVKQLTLGLLMYTGDHEGRLPPASGWPGLTFLYVKNETIYLCPQDQRLVKQRQGSLEVSYTMNDAMSGVKLPTAGQDKTLPLVFDGTAIHGRHEAAAFRHQKGLSVGFADGHARWVGEGDFAAVPLSPTEAAGKPPPEEAPKP